MNQMVKIRENLERELSVHSVEEKKNIVESKRWWNDPFHLSNNIIMFIQDAQDELMYLGCYLTCQTNDMKYMYQGLYQGNRLNAAWDASHASGTDHGRFFVRAVTAFACNDYELIEKLLPYSLGPSTNDARKEMTNLLMAIYYKDVWMRTQAMEEAKGYLSKRHAKYEVLIVEYMVSLLEKDGRRAGSLLGAICELIGRADLLLEECAGFSKKELGKCICLLGHGLYAMADYYLDESEMRGFACPKHDTFLNEYEWYRKACKDSQHNALATFDGDKSFLNDILKFIPEVTLIRERRLVYTDAEGFQEQLSDQLRIHGKLKVLEESTDIAWIARWCGEKKFFAYYQKGDEKKLFAGRGLIYYALSNPDPNVRYEISRFLLEQNVNIELVQKEWDGPFHYLFRQKKHDICQTTQLCGMLLKAGANPNQAGARNYLPIDLLLMMDYPEAELQPLYDYWMSIPDLDVRLRTFEGLLPYDIAKQYGRRRMMKKLKELENRQQNHPVNSEHSKDISETTAGKVVLKKVPDDKLKTLVRIKKAFELTLTTKELLEGLGHLPFTIADGISEAKAVKIIEEEKLTECICFEKYRI